MATQAASAVAIKGGTATVTSVSATSFAAFGSATTSYPTLYIDAIAGTSRQIVGSVAGLTRWQFNLGDDAAETGSNAGSNLTARRYNDAGVAIDTPFAISRATGRRRSCRSR